MVITINHIHHPPSRATRLPHCVARIVQLALTGRYVTFLLGRIYGKPMGFTITEDRFVQMATEKNMV